MRKCALENSVRHVQFHAFYISAGNGEPMNFNLTTTSKLTIVCFHVYILPHSLYTWPCLTQAVHKIYRQYLWFGDIILCRLSSLQSLEHKV